MSPWRRERYLLHARTREHQRRVDAARRIIAQALAMGERPYVSWSGGKDSTCVLELVREQMPDVPALCSKDDLDFPGSREFCEQYAARRGVNLHIVTPREPVLSTLIRLGGPRVLHAPGNRLDELAYFGPMREAARQLGCTMRVLGLRADESRARRFNRATRGPIYRHRDGSWVVCPIADWSVADVWAFIMSRELPYLYIYDLEEMADDPEQLRECWWIGGPTAAGYGQLAWLKYHFPQLHRKLVELWPDWSEGA